MERFTTTDGQREKQLYPTLMFADQLARLEALANETDQGVATLVRAAIDAYLIRRPERLR